MSLNWARDQHTLLNGPINADARRLIFLQAPTTFHDRPTAPVGSVIVPSTRVPLVQVRCAETVYGIASPATISHFIQLRNTALCLWSQNPRSCGYQRWSCKEGSFLAANGQRNERPCLPEPIHPNPPNPAVLADLATGGLCYLSRAVCVARPAHCGDTSVRETAGCLDERLGDVSPTVLPPHRAGNGQHLEITQRRNFSTHGRATTVPRPAKT